MEQSLSHNDVKSCVRDGVAYPVEARRARGAISATAWPSVTRGCPLQVPMGSSSCTHVPEHRVARQLAGDRCHRVRGTPDMVLEILSDHSEEKDLVRLPDLGITAPKCRSSWRRRCPGRVAIRDPPLTAADTLPPVADGGGTPTCSGAISADPAARRFAGSRNTSFRSALSDPGPGAGGVCIPTKEISPSLDME